MLESRKGDSDTSLWKLGVQQGLQVGNLRFATRLCLNREKVGADECGSCTLQLGPSNILYSLAYWKEWEVWFEA